MTTVFTFLTRTISILVIGIAVTIGVIGKYQPELFLRLPMGFVPWAITGNRMPPYFDESCLYEENWSGRKGDVVISSGAKAGTLWLHTIVLLLRSGGWDDFAEESLTAYYGSCEMLQYPEHTLSTRLAEMDDKRALAKAKGFHGFQIFTHKFPGEDSHLFGVDPEKNPDVKYIAIVRNGKEVLKSFLPFINSHTEDFRNMWGGFPPKMDGPEDIVKFAVDDMPHFYFGHLTSWWDRKHLPNVLLLHYRNLRSDPSSTIQKIANFLEIPLSDELLNTILHKTSLEYMTNASTPTKYTGLVGYPGRKMFPIAEIDSHVRPGGGKLHDHSRQDDFFTDDLKAKWEEAIQEHFGHDPSLLVFADTGAMQ